jgi:hypothetical protein
MQIDLIWRVADGAKNGAFAIVGVGQHLQRLIGVRRDHDMVIDVASAMTVVDDHALRCPFDRSHGAAQPKLIPVGRRQFLDIAPAAALYGAPDRAIILQQAMIVEECDEVLGREVQHFGGWRGPDRSPHRREIIGQQPRREVVTLEILPQRQPFQSARGMIRDTLGVEGQDVAKHPEIGR